VRELLATGPVRPNFAVPGLRFPVGDAFDFAQVGGAVYRRKTTGKLEAWRLYEHRSGARALVSTQDAQLGVTPVREAELPKLETMFSERLLKLPQGCPPLSCADEQRIWARWGDLAPAVFEEQTDGRRDRWVEHLVTSVAIEVGRDAAIAPEEDFCADIAGVLRARDEATKPIGSLRWLEAPRAALCAWVLQEAGANQQDGVEDALRLSPEDLCAALSSDTLQKIADALRQLAASPYHGQGLLRFSPVDVVHRMLEPVRDPLNLCLTHNGLALPWAPGRGIMRA